MLEKILSEKGLSIRECAAFCGIPYSTMCDIVKKKTKIENCSYKTVASIASLLGTTTEALVSGESMLNFRDELHHELHRLGDIAFLVKYLPTDQIKNYWNAGNRAFALYLLAMIDYLCRRNDLPYCEEFDQYRVYALEQRLDFRSDSSKKGRFAPIDEFLQHNIYEGDIDDAV